MARKIVGRFCRKVKTPKGKFAKASFRWTKRGENWLLVGCPKGKWMPLAKHCLVGTRLREILVQAPARGKCCKASRGVCIKKG